MGCTNSTEQDILPEEPVDEECEGDDAEQEIEGGDGQTEFAANADGTSNGQTEIAVNPDGATDRQTDLDVYPEGGAEPEVAAEAETVGVTVAVPEGEGNAKELQLQRSTKGTGKQDGKKGQPKVKKQSGKIKQKFMTPKLHQKVKANVKKLKKGSETKKFVSKRGKSLTKLSKSKSMPKASGKKGKLSRVSTSKDTSAISQVNRQSAGHKRIPKSKKRSAEPSKSVYKSRPNVPLPPPYSSTFAANYKSASTGSGIQPKTADQSRAGSSMSGQKSSTAGSTYDTSVIDRNGNSSTGSSSKSNSSTNSNTNKSK